MSEDSEPISVTWRNSLFGLGTAVCFAVSAIFIRNGLEGLPSPLVGISVGMIITAVIYDESLRRLVRDELPLGLHRDAEQACVLAKLGTEMGPAVGGK